MLVACVSLYESCLDGLFFIDGYGEETVQVGILQDKDYAVVPVFLIISQLFGGGQTGRYLFVHFPAPRIWLSRVPVPEKKSPLSHFLFALFWIPSRNLYEVLLFFERNQERNLKNILKE